MFIGLSMSSFLADAVVLQDSAFLARGSWKFARIFVHGARFLSNKNKENTLLSKVQEQSFNNELTYASKKKERRENIK